MKAEGRLGSRFLQRLARGQWGLTMALCLTGFVLLLSTLDVPVSVVYGGRGTTGIVAISFATMGALLAARRPGNPIGWLFAAARAMHRIRRLRRGTQGRRSSANATTLARP